MSTLDELRSYVRTQTETTASELPNSTIDRYLQEAFNRTIASETDWPFFEEVWAVVQTAGDATAPIPVDVDGISSLKDVDNSNFRLTMIAYDEAEDQYFRSVAASSNGAYEYSVWKSLIYFWPSITYTVDRNYSLRGYRKPLDWLAGDPASVEPDADVRLHLPLSHYAIALAYAQQEAMDLEAQYMDRWSRDVELARKAIMEPQKHQPLIMGPNRITRIGHGRYRTSYTIGTP
jgi:hypothetical protein